MSQDNFRNYIVDLRDPVADGGDADMNLYYTLDGSTPTSSSTPYTGPITLAEGEVLKIIAINGPASEIAQANAPTCAGLNLVLENNVLLDDLELTITELEEIQNDDWTEFGHGVDVTIDDNPDLTSVSFAGLTIFGNTNNIASGVEFAITNNPLLVDTDLAALATIRANGSLIISNNDTLPELDLSSLASMGEGAVLSIQQNADLAALDLSAALQVGLVDGDSARIEITSNPALVAPTLGAFVVKDGATIDFTGNALNAATVNHILARCVASSTFQNGTIDLSGGTNAAPTGQGIADKATLVGRVGLSVTTN